MSTSVSTQRLGITELGTGFNIDFNDAWHYAIQGMSRSGKSVLVYSLLAPLAACDNVRICGVDPTGIMLKPWQEHPGSEYRHLGGKDLQHAADVLASLCDEMDRRIQDMLAAYKDKIEVFTPDLPLLVVVLEEYPGLLALAESYDTAAGLKPAERVQNRIKRSVRRLVQEGAKAGIRLVLIAQRMDASIVGGAERSNFGVRITMRVDNADAVGMLHPSATPDDLAVALASRTGEGVFQHPDNGSTIRRFKASYASYDQYVDYGRGRL